MIGENHGDNHEVDYDHQAHYYNTFNFLDTFIVISLVSTLLSQSVGKGQECS